MTSDNEFFSVLTDYNVFYVREKYA